MYIDLNLELIKGLGITPPQMLKSKNKSIQYNNFINVTNN